MTHDDRVDLLVGAERRLAGHGDGGHGGQVPDHVEAAQLAADLLRRHALYTHGGPLPDEKEAGGTKAFAFIRRRGGRRGKPGRTIAPMSWLKVKVTLAQLLSG